MKFTRNSICCRRFYVVHFYIPKLLFKEQKMCIGSYLQIFVLHGIKSIVAVLLMIILEHDY